jgi:TorA maturation chaperone TorD
MDDRDLQEAIRFTSEVSDLARQIGMPRPSDSSIILTQKVLSMEAVMQSASDILWSIPEGELPAIDDVESARAEEYALIAVLLARPPDAVTLNRIAELRGDDTPLGLAHLELAQAAADTNAERVKREFFDLFIGVGRGELLPYSSYYLTGFLNERPLARLRENLRVQGIERAEGQTEPEDHAASLCEIMSGLAGGDFATVPSVQQQFFEKHVANWMGHFFADMERAAAAEFYRFVGRVGRLFVEIEMEAFTLPPLEGKRKERTSR